MLRVNRFVPIASLSFVWLAAATVSAAEKLPLVRVVADNAIVRSRPEARAAVIQPAAAGAVLEAVDRDNDWYWVILPADDNGTRGSGWIHARDVEIVGEGEPRTVLRHFTEAVEAARTREREAAARAAADEGARAERAQQEETARTARTERARREEAVRAGRTMREAAARRERAERKENERLARARVKLERARRAYEAATGQADGDDATAAQPSSPKPPTPKRQQ